MPRVAINGLGRMGKLVVRALCEEGFDGEIVLLNDKAGDPIGCDPGDVCTEAIVDLSTVLRLDKNPDHADQARRALARAATS